ncbi:hypothetical protein DENIT_20070 [Pseudomonas veronii]|nr:hypothetical protein DENIT_20070 [Pseudomonas veronii]
MFYIGLPRDPKASYDIVAETKGLMKLTQGSGGDYDSMSSTLEIIHKYHIISAQISAWEKPF